MRPSVATRTDAPVLAAAAWAAAGAYALAGLAAMWLVAPRVPYADQWRIYRTLIERPFPAGVVAVDNGHREVLPNLVRLAELDWMHADQRLQIAVAMLCALMAFAGLAIAAARASSSAAVRAGAALAAALGVFWLGNERALAHANEAVHAYPVLACLVGALLLAARPAPVSQPTRMWGAAALAIAGTFSFGSGIAIFPATMLVLLLRGAPVRAWLPVACALLLALALYLWGAFDATVAATRIDPLGNAALVLRWLAAPLVHAVWPLLDPQLAERLREGTLQQLVAAVAGAAAAFGDLRHAGGPQAVVGLGGVVGFVVLCRRALRAAPNAAVAQHVALGVAGFSLAVGAVIALSRAAYFELHPLELQAPRYLVWSSLFWSGMLMACVLRAATPRRAAIVALAAAVLIAPSEWWMGKRALHMRAVADDVALGATVGVLARDTETGETVLDELSAALPLLARRHAAMYAWPEAGWIGRTAAPGSVRLLASEGLGARAVDNTLGGDGMLLDARVPDATRSRLLVLDADAKVVGIVQRSGIRSGADYRGWVRGSHAAAALRVAELR